MNNHKLTLVIIAVFVSLSGCCRRPHPKLLPEVAEQLAQQFRTQHESRSHRTFGRKIEAVQITSFSFPSGNPHPYLGIGVTWDGAITYTAVPMIHLGDGLFGVTYQDATTKEELSAVISFR
jgi:hypothetical protein